MTTKPFFIILIRAITLLIVIRAVATILPEVIAGLISLGDSTYFGYIAGMLARLVVYLVMGYLISGRAEWIVDRFKLLRGVEEERVIFEKISPVQGARLAVYIVGLLLIGFNLIEFLTELWYTFKGAVSGGSLQIGSLWIQGAHILLGVLLIGYCKTIAGMMIRDPRKDSRSLDRME